MFTKIDHQMPSRFENGRLRPDDTDEQNRTTVRYWIDAMLSAKQGANFEKSQVKLHSTTTRHAGSKVIGEGGTRESYLEFKSEKITKNNIEWYAHLTYSYDSPKQVVGDDAFIQEVVDEDTSTFKSAGYRGNAQYLIDDC